MSVLFSSVSPSAPPWETFTLHSQYTDDDFEEKVNLIFAAYRKDDGKPWVLPVVRKIEASLAADESTDHEYLSPRGIESFYTAATTFVLGKDSIALKEKRAVGIQTLSCTGALWLGARFLVEKLGAKHFYYSAQTWAGTVPVFEDAGFEKGFSHRYWDKKRRCIDMEGLLEDLSLAKPNSVIFLQASAHNPTGCDPTPEQWAQIADVMKERRLFPFFDAVYQGYATGDFEKDAWAVRFFVDQGFEMLCAHSFSKTMNVASLRVGNLIIVAKEASPTQTILMEVMHMIRGCYNSPPSHGGKIVSAILNDPDLVEEWRECVQIMCARIHEMRKTLRKRLEELGTPGTWDHITSQIGMSLFTGLSPLQAQYLKEKYHIYIQSNGRISMGMVTSHNVDRVANGIHNAVVNVKE